MKHFLLLVMLFVAGNFFAKDYYVSNSGGDDANDGLTKSTPWKTLGKLYNNSSIVAGDVIHLKRGDIWYGESLKINLIGAAGNPITFTDYGSGNLPEVCAMATFDNTKITWTDNGSHIWEATINADVIGSTWNENFSLERLYINNNEVLGTPTVDNVGTSVPDRVVFCYNDTIQLLTLYSEADPSTLKIECSNSQYAVNFVYEETPDWKIEYVNIENIKITGGNICGINMRAGENINLKNLDLGDKSLTAVYINEAEDNISKNIVIDSCKFDARYDFDFSSAPEYAYNRGPQYGIWGRFSSNVEIKNSTFHNFTNASLILEGYLENKLCTNYKVHDNLFTASLAAHGGRIDIGTGVESLEFYNNIIDSVSGYVQLRGNANHYHHNIIRNVRNSPLDGRRTGFGITTFDNENPDGASTTNNIYENNVIVGCENAGIYLRGSADYSTVGNTFRNNIFINNGVGDLNLGFWLEDYGSPNGERVKNNTFENNLFYQEGWTSRLVHMYGHGYSIEKFNAFKFYGFSVSGNFISNPLFIDLANGDYHLQSESPAINNGVATLATLDFDGNTIPSSETSPDIGIYEFQGATKIDEKLFESNILVYPNPSNGIINLKIDNNSNNAISLTVIDITGRKLWQKQFTGLQIEEPINLSGIGKGYYFLKISNGGETTTKNIIIE